MYKVLFEVVFFCILGQFSGNLGVALGEALLGLFLHGYNSRLFQRLYKERSINEIRFDRICPHLLRDPLLSPMDCHVMDIDLAKLKPPKGVHFGIVPNADLGAASYPSTGARYDTTGCPTSHSTPTSSQSHTIIHTSSHTSCK